MGGIASGLSGFFQWLGGLFKWWVNVMPWEAGLRVRWGRHITRLGPGIHLRVPLMHTVFVQSTRQRRSDLPIQTITTKNGRTVTIGGSLGFAIGDVLTLYQTLHHPDGTLGLIAQSAVADHIAAHDDSECTPGQIQLAVSLALDLSKYGLKDASISITDFAFVRTYRLIQDQRWGSSNSLETTAPAGANQ